MNAYVSQMSLDDLWFLVLGGFLFSLVELLDESHRLAGEAPTELSASAGGEEWEKLNGLHVEEGIEIDASEGELLESPTLSLNSFAGIRHLETKGLLMRVWLATSLLGFDGEEQLDKDRWDEAGVHRRRRTICWCDSN